MIKRKLSQFNFDLPEELLADRPAANRDESRLMIVDRKTGTFEHRMFKDVWSRTVHAGAGKDGPSPGGGLHARQRRRTPRGARRAAGAAGAAGAARVAAGAAGALDAVPQGGSPVRPRPGGAEGGGWRDEHRLQLVDQEGAVHAQQRATV